MTADGIVPALETRRLMVASLVGATLLVALVSTLGVPLAPLASDRYGVSLGAAQWILTISLLVAVVATPSLGRLGDGSGRRPVLIATMLAFVAGSLIAATAGSFAQLLVGRALQGIGYGIFPLAMALVREHAPADAAGGIAALSVTVPVGVGLGWPITGLLVEQLGFSSAFWFAAIAGVVACAAVARTVPRTDEARSVPSFDTCGALLLAVGLAVLLLALTHVSTWPVPNELLLAAVGGATLTAWAATELAHASPLIDLRGVLHRSLVGPNAAALLMSMSMFVGMSTVSRLALTPADSGYGFGATPLQTGLLLLPMSIGTLAAQPLARRLARRLGSSRVLAIGAGAVGAALLGMSLLHRHPSAIVAATTLFGIGNGCTFAQMPGLILGRTGLGRTGSAMAFNQVLRNLGGSTGSALAGVILTLSIRPGSSLPQEWGYTVALLASTIGPLVTGILVLGADHGMVITPR